MIYINFNREKLIYESGQITKREGFKPPINKVYITVLMLHIEPLGHLKFKTAALKFKTAKMKNQTIFKLLASALLVLIISQLGKPLTDKKTTIINCSLYLHI